MWFCYNSKIYVNTWFPRVRTSFWQLFYKRFSIQHTVSFSLPCVQQAQPLLPSETSTMKVSPTIFACVFSALVSYLHLQRFLLMQCTIIACLCDNLVTSQVCTSLYSRKTPSNSDHQSMPPGHMISDHNTAGHTARCHQAGPIF